MPENPGNPKPRLKISSVDKWLRDYSAFGASASKLIALGDVSLGKHLASIELPRLTAPGILGASEALRTVEAAHLNVTSLLGAATPNLVSAWREAAFAGVPERVAVASSMARVIGEANLGMLAAQTFAPVDLVGASLRRAIAEAAATYETGVGAAIRAAVENSVWPAAFSATNTLRATIDRQVEQGQLAHRALLEMGWWFPSNAPVTWLFRLGKIARTEKRVDLRRAMVSVGDTRWFGRIMSDWMELDVMRDRRRFIADGFRQHRAGNYRVAIPVLLPHLEGIAVDAFEPRSTKPSPKDAVATAATVATISGPAIVEAITILWAYRTFSDVPAGSRQLNRHLVLHGRSTGFGTAENSIKLLFAFDILAAVIREAEEERKRLASAAP